MPFVPVENTVLVEFRYLYDSQKCENTLWFTAEEAPTPANMTVLLGSLRSWFTSDLADFMVEDVSLSELVATDQTSNTGPQVGVDTTDLTGNVEETGNPGNVTYTVSFRTAFRGRSFRGRNYICGVPISVVENINHVLATYRSGLVAAYTNLITTVDLGVYVWSAVSRFSGVDPDTHVPIPREAGISTPITSATTVDDILDSQRRRLPGRGN